MTTDETTTKIATADRAWIMRRMEFIRDRNRIVGIRANTIGGLLTRPKITRKVVP